MEAKKLDKKNHVNLETGFTCRYIRSETENFHPHSHNYYEIFLIVKNEAWHMINGGKQLLSEGDLLFIRDFDVHDYMPAEENFDFINISFEPEVLESLREYLGECFDFDRLLSSPLPPSVSLVESEARRLSSKLSDLNMDEDIMTRKLRLKRLLLDIFTTHFREGRKQETEAPLWLESVCEKMKKRENFALGTERMFELSGKSREHLSRSLKKYYGTTPSEYVSELRLSYAASMLKFSNLSVTDICYECGFSNISWFYSLFKKKFSVSPSKFRGKYQYINA